MLVAVFGDAHAHAEAFAAVVTAAAEHGAQQLWSLGDMIGGGPDPALGPAVAARHSWTASADRHVEAYRIALGS